MFWIVRVDRYALGYFDNSMSRFAVLEVSERRGIFMSSIDCFTLSVDNMMKKRVHSENNFFFHSTSID